MLQFLLYCDLATMNCTASDINAELGSFASSYVQVNNNLWFFSYPKAFDGHFLPKEEALFCDHFEKFSKEDSVIFLAELGSRYYYNLPDAAHQFFSKD